MNKSKLVEIIRKKIGMSKNEAIQTVEITFDSIKDALQNSEIIDIYGFGRFEVKEVKERNGINPKTKEKIIIPATKKVVFKSSKSLKEKVK